MRIFIFNRLKSIVVTFFGITVITFAVTELAPGDPTDIQTQLNPKISLEAKEELKKRYGLDQPMWQRYFTWVGGVLKLDFGHSFKDGEKVIHKIGKRIPITLLINGLSLLLILMIAIPIGVYGAIHAGKWQDHLLTWFVFIGFSMPTFWLALLLMTFFGVKLQVLPISGLHALDYEYFSFFEKTIDLAWHLVLPIFVSAFTGLAGVARFMRTGMLEVLNQEYIKTAWSKGLTAKQVYLGHAFRNAILPIVTIIGLSIPTLLGGSVIFETIFSIPGLGKLMYDAVLARDLPVYMALLMMSAVLTLLGNLLADLAYAKVDPRIRYE